MGKRAHGTLKIPKKVVVAAQGEPMTLEMGLKRGTAHTRSATPGEELNLDAKAMSDGLWEVYLFIYLLFKMYDKNVYHIT